MKISGVRDNISKVIDKMIESVGDVEPVEFKVIKTDKNTYDIILGFMEKSEYKSMIIYFDCEG